MGEPWSEKDSKINLLYVGKVKAEMGLTDVCLGDNWQGNMSDVFFATTNTPAGTHGLSLFVQTTRSARGRDGKNHIVYKHVTNITTNPL